MILGYEAMQQKHFKNFIVIVDGYRRPSRKRNTAGMYRVGAKTKEEARELVQQAIGFGSVLVYREDPKLVVPYGKVRIVSPDGSLKPARKANTPFSKK